MTAAEVKDRLLAELKNAKYGASTRLLCNQIFQKNHAKYIVLPGDHRMKQVYGYLKTLQKQGKVTSDYPGHWKLTRIEPSK